MSGISLSLSVNSVSSLEWVRLDFLEDCREELISACRESSPLSKKTKMFYTVVWNQNRKNQNFSPYRNRNRNAFPDPVPDLG
jgi:hypothetical protein